MARQPLVADVERGGPRQAGQLVVGGVAVAPPHRRPSGTRSRRCRSSWLATAHGGVPNVRGHGGWIRPATSTEDVTRACIASTSARNASRRRSTFAAVGRVAQPLGGDQAGRAAGALVRLPRARPGNVSHGGSGSRSRISAYASSARDRTAAEGDRVPHHPALRTHQGPAAADQHQRRLAVLAQVAGEPPPEGHERVLGDAVRRLQQALALGTPGRPPGRRCPRRRTGGDRRGRAAARRTGRRGRCRRPARRPGPRGRACGWRRARRRAATSPGGPSR